MDVISNIFQVSPFAWQARVETEHSTSTLELGEDPNCALYFCTVLGGRLHVHTLNQEPQELHPGDSYVSTEWPNEAVRLSPQGGATLLHLQINNAPGSMHHLVSALPPTMLLKPQGPDRELVRAMQQLIADEIGQPIAGSYSVVGRLIDIMFLSALRERLKTPGLNNGYLAALADKHLAPAIDRMHAEPAYNWGLAKLAAIAGLSRTAFATHFKDVVGIPPLQYLMEWRMTLAVEQIKMGTVTIAELANNLGYASESAFYKAFKKIHGSSPRAYINGKAAEAATEAAY